MNYDKSVRCDCAGGEHYIFFYVMQDEPIIYVDICAKQKLPLWCKIKEIFKYLFRNDPLCYDGICLNKEKSEEIVEFLQKTWMEKENK